MNYNSRNYYLADNQILLKKYLILNNFENLFQGALYYLINENGELWIPIHVVTLFLMHSIYQLKHALPSNSPWNSFDY